MQQKFNQFNSYINYHINNADYTNLKPLNNILMKIAENLNFSANICNILDFFKFNLITKWNCQKIFKLKINKKFHFISSDKFPLTRIMVRLGNNMSTTVIRLFHRMEVYFHNWIRLIFENNLIKYYEKTLKHSNII